MRNAFLILLFLMPASGLQAQFGFEIGMSTSSYRYSGTQVPTGSYESDLRPYLGYDIEWLQTTAQKPLLAPWLSIYYDIVLCSWFALRPELSYTQRGVSFNQYDFEAISYQVRANYMDLPLSAHFRFVNREHYIASFYTGGYASYNLRTVKKTSSRDEPVQRVPIDNVMRFGGGLQAGLNTARKSDHGNFSIDLRVVFGLNNVFTLPDNRIRLYEEVKSVNDFALVISLGYAL